MAIPKPDRGTAALERRQKRLLRARHERAVMDDCKRRDRYRCRFPGCTYHDLVVHACHLEHRGMGGNPTGDRTIRQKLITLCAYHHGELDRGRLMVTPLTEKGTDGLVGWAYDLVFKEARPLKGES